MLVLNPRSVTFGGQEWDDVAAVQIDRVATRTVESWSDLGPHVVFADVGEERVVVTVTQTLGPGGISTVGPGESATLSFFASAGATDSGRKRVEIDAVVTGVRHELSQKRGAVRTVTCVGVSPDGDEDPVRVADA